MQKHVNLVDLVKSFPTNIYLQNLASIQKRTSPVKFAHLAEKSGKGSISNLSTKVREVADPQPLMEDVIACLDFPESSVRLAAAETVAAMAGTIGSPSFATEVGSLIQGFLTHTDSRTRYAAVKALDGLSELCFHAHELLEPCVEDEDKNVRLAAGRALCRVPALVERFDIEPFSDFTTK